MITTRLDSRQRAALGTLRSAWTSAEILAGRTELYRSTASISAVMRQLAEHGLVEGRYQADKNRPTEWRITEAGAALLGPIVARDPS